MRMLALSLALLLPAGVALARPKKGASIEVPIEAKSGSKLTGTVTLSQKGKTVTMKIAVAGLPPGLHAVHVHEHPDCSSPDGKSAGGHWNPMTQPHGQWGHEHHHLGDIGNLKVNADGQGTLTFSTDRWTLGSGQPSDLLGHSVVVHEKVDDFVTQPTGNAGGRIGCAVLPAR